MIYTSWNLAMATVRQILSDGLPHDREKVIENVSSLVDRDEALEAARIVEYWHARHRKQSQLSKAEYRAWVAEHPSAADFLPQRYTREELIALGARTGLMSRINKSKDIESLRSHPGQPRGIVLIRLKGGDAASSE